MQFMNEGGPVMYLTLLIGIATTVTSVYQIRKRDTNLLAVTLGGMVLVLVVGLFGVCLGLVTTFEALLVHKAELTSPQVYDGVAMSVNNLALAVMTLLGLVPLATIGQARRLAA